MYDKEYQNTNAFEAGEYEACIFRNCSFAKLDLRAFRL